MATATSPSSSAASSPITTVHSACPHDCPDNCAMLVQVQDGKAISVRGDPKHSFTRGGLCVKVNNYEDRVYSPDRLLYPLKRVDAKGTGQFARISWKEAIDTIAANWQSVSASHGPEAIMPYCYMGNAGMVNGAWSGDALFNRLGATIAEKTFCDSGAASAYIMTVGPTATIDSESFVHSKYIILWACNTISTNLHHWPFIAEAQEKGAKVVVIDPVATRTAKKADWHIPIRPGTDGALALGMMNVIIAEGLHDKDYVEKYTNGFDELAARAAEYWPDKVSQITGIPAADIRQLAREYAKTSPAAIRIGVAIERHTGGGQAVRAITCLPGLVGAFRHVGGGILALPVWPFPVKWDRLMRPDLGRSGTRVINQWKLAGALNGDIPEVQGTKPPIKSLFIYNTNPMVVVPEQERLRKGLAREDLFTVVAEHFMTDTARYADIVLPATTALEHRDVVLSWGHFHLIYNEPAVAPLGESLPNQEIFRRLGRAMGFEDFAFSRDDAQMIRDVFDWSAATLAGTTYDSLRENGWVRLTLPAPDKYCPHKEGGFPTPSGKLEFKAMAAMGGNFVAPIFRQGTMEHQDGSPVDPVPHYIPPQETIASSSLARQYPLAMISPKSHALLNSQYANMPKQLYHAGKQQITLNPADAQARKIADGTSVRIHNDRGSFEAVAHVSADVMQGLVVAPLGYWASSSGGSTVAAVNSSRYADIGRAPTFSDTRVQVSAII
jgi:anaerobic selenocysteine-containing dehydrogenase